MVTKDQHIPLIVTQNTEDTPGYRSIFFSRPAGFVFEAGDWIDLEFDGRELKGGKTYSISSSPTETDIRITFREGISEFKMALQLLTPNERVFISQFGNDYGFQLKKNRSSTLIAGGVGIAPFRSMLKEMYDNRDKNEVTLVYLNQNDTFLFEAELTAWQKALPNLSIAYVPTKSLNRKKREKLLAGMIKTIHQNFYISGPPGMVESAEHFLLAQEVEVRDIRIDSFGGY